MNINAKERKPGGGHIRGRAFVLFVLLATSLQAGEINFQKIIEGIGYKGLKNVAVNELPPQGSWACQTGRRVNEQDLKKDLNNLYLTGYFSAVSAATVVSENRLILEFSVQENPVIKQIFFRGNACYHENYLKALLPVRENQILNVQKLVVAKEVLTKLYAEQGYDLFKVISIEMDADGNLTFALMEGEIEEIEFMGLKNIQPFVLQRTVKLKKGDIFNSLDLAYDREKLFRLGYFAEIYAPVVAESLDKKKVRLTYKVSEKKINLLDLGLEQERELIVGFIKANYNHLFQHSDLITGKVQIGWEQQRLQAHSYLLRYEQPWLFNCLPISGALDVWKEYRKEYLTSDWTQQNIKDTQRIGGDVILGFPIITDRLLLNTIYKKESVNPKEVGAFGSYMINSLSGVLRYQSITNRNNPKKGTYWDLELEKGGSLWLFQLGGLNFSRVSLNWASFFGLSEPLTLAVHVFGGIFKPNTEQIETFETEGYVIGGSSSLRGYKETNPERGLKKVLANVELRYDLNNDVQVVLFADVGKAFNDDLYTNSLQKGYGVGCRYFTPVGPIRLDASWGESFIVHLALGQLF